MWYNQTVNSLSVDAMQQLAQKLAGSLGSQDVIALKGIVGAGKTTFARALIQAIAPGTEVTSPTFTLMQSYPVTIEEKPQILWHLDLYRLEEPSELEALGLEELWPHIVLIEWPEIAQTRLPDTGLSIEITCDQNSETRNVIFSGNDTWKIRLEKIL